MAKLRVDVLRLLARVAHPPGFRRQVAAQNQPGSRLPPVFVLALSNFALGRAESVRFLTGIVRDLAESIPFSSITLQDFTNLVRTSAKTVRDFINLEQDL